MVLSYITTMLYSNHLSQHNDDIDEELTLPIQMPESPPPTSITASKHHIISIIDFMRHTRHTQYTQEHRISIPTISRL